MADERAQFQRADALFDAALDRNDAERLAWVIDATPNEPELRARVIALLAAYDQSTHFLERAVPPDPLMMRLQSALGDAYRIQRRIASGGMASVYLAHDVRHGRQVAVKAIPVGNELNGSAPNTNVLREMVLLQSKIAARFLTEIRVTARLQHPHVLPLFDSGADSDLAYYVMPLVEGGTLRDLLKAQSPLLLDDALRLTHSIAGAVQHAHAQGVIHRDLKPENILLRDGEPLVADFGIALGLADMQEHRLTQAGTLIGTAQYMSPEQAAADPAIDLRTDIYSLGAMLYEMLTGDPPHVASTTQGVLAKVRAERATSVHLLREAIPLAVSAVVDRALAKRAADRYQTMAEFDSALQAAARETPSERSAISDSQLVRTTTHSMWPKRIALLGLVFAAASVGVIALQRRANTGNTSRFVVTPLTDAATGRTPTITPDGAALIYAGSAETGRRLFVRNVNELTARALPGTEGALSSFVSPDGKWIGFITADDKLVKVPAQGGTPTVLSGVFRYSDGVWAGNHRLIISGYGQQGLSWTSASGGALHSLTKLDTARKESDHAKPFVLPDNRTVIFTIARSRTGPGPSVGELAIVTLDTARADGAPVARLDLQSRGAVGFVDGWLLYVSADGSGIQAIRLDVARRALISEPVRVLEQPDNGIRVASLAANGTLLYTRMLDVNAPVLVDSNGVARPLLGAVTGSFMNPRLSPDGTHLAVQATTKSGNDVWVYDIATGTPTHITSSGSAVGPSWTADGKSVVFFSTSGGMDAAWRADIQGNTAPERVISSTGLFALSPASNGQDLLYQRMIDGVWSVWYANIVNRMDMNRAALPVVNEQYDAFMPTLSPDGKWLAYSTNESGRYEVYVRSFPNPGPVVQISQNGGTEPSWSRDGHRLFFRGARQMFVADLALAPALSVKSRRVLFTDAFDGDMPMPHRNYDVTRDGQFIMIAANTGDKPQTIVVLNWLQELRTRLQATR